MRYHLIAIGGRVMHNVAIDLQDMGHIVTGSDDEIYNPSRDRLASYDLLPDKMGWDAERITEDMDAIILGKHARDDNPELARAQALGLPIYSFPEFISKNSKATQRVCVAGSHGKTSTTAMIMHVLRHNGLDFDYLVGDSLEGFGKMVKISDADILVVEGDEYPSSCIDNRAKMIHYQPNISVITGLAWDHVNIYKTYEDYKDAFRSFLSLMERDAVCFFDQTDAELVKMMATEHFPCIRTGYYPLDQNKKSQVVREDQVYNINVFGRHNLLNMHAALHSCKSLGIEEEAFFEAIASFTGAANRLEKIYESTSHIVYKDFAHAPSKCRATVNAVRSQHPNKKIKGILELHTFSSLNKDFLPHYSGSLDGLDMAAVLYDPHAMAMKKMLLFDKSVVSDAFGYEGLLVLNERAELEDYLTNGEADIILIMSSGNLAGMDMGAYIDSLK